MSRTRMPRIKRARLLVSAMVVVSVLLGTVAQTSPSLAATDSDTSVPQPHSPKPVKGHPAAKLTGASVPASSESASFDPADVVSPGSFTVDTPTSTAHPKLQTRATHGGRSSTHPAVPATVAGAWSTLGGTALRVAAAKTTTQSPAVRVNVTVLTAGAVKKHHLAGLVLQISRADGKDAAAPVAVQIPQAMLSATYGADFASRVQWVQVPATTDVQGAPAAALTPVAATTDAGTDSVVITPQAKSASVMVMALSAPVSSSGTGSFAATPLNSASTWDVSGQTGDFTWAYGMRTPPAAAGPSPSLALSYDSQSVDGETGATNNQPSAVGEGWSLAGGGFIERSYVSCSLDNGASGPVTTSGDLCWKTDNATISVAGHSGELVKDTATQAWKLQSDDGTRFEHLVGSGAGCGPANGTYDDDCWRMTTTDGTQYFFGMNQLPGWATGKPTTSSAWTVPVYGNDPGEPCHAATFTASSCTQAWRWNLDYVVDVHGNAEALYYDAETNKYAQNGAAAASYTRGGQLDHIDYGLTSATIYGANAASDRVTFGYDTYGRCSDSTHANCTSEPLTAPATAPANPTSYPDVPFDQLCTGTTCTTTSPSFFTDGMLATVTTSALISGAYQTVDAWALSHSFPAPGDGTNAALWLTQVSHTGSAAGQSSITEPPTVFTGTTLQNRVNTQTQGLAPLDKWRLSSIQTSLGGVISVNYSAQQCTPAGAAAIEAAPQSNTNWCFPAWWTPGVIGAQTPQIDLFHKYVVTSTISNPTTGGALDHPVETDYVYGTPRWRYDTSPLTLDSERTWNQYVGVDTLEIRVGDHNTPSAQQTTDYTYYQGMDGDRAGTSGGAKSVTVKGTSVADARWFAGQVYEQKTLLGVGGSVLSDTINTPWASAVTANDGTNTARMTGMQDTVTTEPVSTGGTRTSETKTTFDATRGYPLTVSTIPSDATGTCTTVTYTTPNTGAWIVGSPQEVQKVGTTCADLGSASYPRDLISDTRSYYDGAALGAVGARGDVTSTSQVDSYTGSTPHWVTSSTAGYDSLGRVTTATDVLGHTTTTAYTPATGGPLTSATSTNTLGWATTTAYNPEWGVQTSYTDQNSHLTTATYDALGRRTQVWLPQHTQAANPSSPSLAYAYTLSQTGTNAIQTTTLTSGGSNPVYTLFDGLGQPVQTQTIGGSGTAITSTGYDTAGRVNWVDNPYWTTSVTPSGTLFVPASETNIASQVRTSFDAAGRATVAATWQTGTERFETDAAYLGVDRVDTTPPAGGTPTSVFTNSTGQKTKLIQYLGSIASGTPQATTYAYNASGAMTGMTDPAGNHWSWGYDVLGHQTSAVDPDTGTTTGTFDDAGNQLTSTDARGQLLTYTYDTVNRKTAEYAGTSTGSLLASWVYDTVAKGDLTSATSYTGSIPGTPGLAYTKTITAYDAGDQPTSATITIPTGAPAFAGTSYTVTDTYGVDEQATSQTDPAAGGLPSEKVSNTFAVNGQVTGFTGTGVSATVAYTEIHQVGTINRFIPNGLFGSPAYSAYSSYGYDQATGIVLGINDNAKFASAGHWVAQRAYTRDNIGDVTSATITANTPATTTQVDCYTYDSLGELTRVFTPGSGSSCATIPSVSVLGGPAPLWDSYTYDTATGNRASVTVHATTTSGSDVTAGYTYPAAGTAQPHTVRTVTGSAATGAGAYTYDQDGNTLTAPGQTLTWDATGKLATDATTAGTGRNVYDGSGALLVQVDPAGAASLFLGDTVLHQTGAGPVSGVRTFSTAGEPVAERTATAGVSGSTLTWLFTDVDGTVDVQTVATTGTTTDQWRDPFGGGIATTTGVWADGNGYLNKPQSTSTGLASLGDRAYNPTLGRFASADPVLATGNPKQVNGYSYAGNNPITNTDPTGDCYEAAMDALTTSSNCAGGHGANMDSAATKRLKSQASGHLSLPPSWSESYAVGVRLKTQGQNILDAIPQRSLWTVTPAQVLADATSRSQAYVKMNIASILTSEQGALLYGWMQGGLRSNLAFGPYSAITQGIRDNSWTASFRANISSALAAGSPLPKNGGYRANSAGLDNPNFVRDAATVADWAAATNVDRTLAVLGTYDLSAKVVTRGSDHTAIVAFTATNPTTLGSAVAWTQASRPLIDSLVDAPGPFSKVTETFTWNESVSW